MAELKKLSDTNLFKPIKIGNSVTLRNRLAFAPTSRFRSSKENVPTDSMLTYYSERAENNGGLLIVEGTMVSPQAGMWENAPMMFNDAQIKGWKRLVDEVHSKGSPLAIQLFYFGRGASPIVLKSHDLRYLAPSAIYIDNTYKKQSEEAGLELEAFTLGEVQQMKKEFITAAKNAIFQCGFDFVEIHVGYMYCLAQFVEESSNQRKDQYGGSIENRSRIVLEIIDELINVIGAEKIGVRFSPYNEFQGGQSVNGKIHPIAQYAYLYSELERRGKEGNRIAFIENVESRVGKHDDKLNFEHSSDWIEQIWSGTLIRTGGFLHHADYNKLIQTVNSDDRTIIGVSRYYTSNPDLAFRLKNGEKLTDYDRSTFYSGLTNEGYLTFPKLNETLNISEILKKTPVPLV